MTFILRVLSLISAFLMVVFLVMPLMAIKNGTSPIRDILAAVFFLVLAALAMRCTKWLWQKRRFWTEIRSLSEVSTFASFILVWPLVNFLEQRTVGAAKDTVHIATILVMVSVYLLVQRYGRTKTTSSVES